MSLSLVLVKGARYITGHHGVWDKSMRVRMKSISRFSMAIFNTEVLLAAQGYMLSAAEGVLSHYDTQNASYSKYLGSKNNITGPRRQFFWLTYLKTLVICTLLFNVLTSQVKSQSWRQISSLAMLSWLIVYITQKIRSHTNERLIKWYSIKRMLLITKSKLEAYQAVIRFCVNY